MSNVPNQLYRPVLRRRSYYGQTNSYPANYGQYYPNMNTQAFLPDRYSDYLPRQNSMVYSQYPNYIPYPESSYNRTVPTPSFQYSYSGLVVSSKGLEIILIATLILIALDLIVVRPQKKLLQ